MNPAQLRAADALSRAALVRAEALTAVTQSGFEYPELLLPVVEAQLKAVSPGEGDPMRVVVVDEKGTVKTGSRGPMSAHELVAQLKIHPSFAKGWGK